MRSRFIPLPGMIIILMLQSCEPGRENPDAGAVPGSKGVFILNEGQFFADNASLSYFDLEESRLYNQLFYAANSNTPLGDVGQSMILSGKMAWIVMNNSGKIWAMDSESFEFAGKVTGLTSPRYMIMVGPARAYVSDLYARQIHIVDTDSFKISGSIDLKNPGGFPGQHTSENMLMVGNRVFVACWSFDNKILVIDPETDRITDSVEVAKQPNSMVLDHEGMLWVLSDGGFEGSQYGQEKAALTRIDPVTLDILRQIRFSGMEESPVDLQTNAGADSVYFLNGDLYKMAVSDLQLPEKAFISAGERNLYSLGTDPQDGTIYLGDAVDFSQRGWVFRYRPSGSLIDSMKVGIIPGHFCFKR